MIIATIIQGGRLAEMDHQTDIPCLFQHSNETQIQSNGQTLLTNPLLTKLVKYPPLLPVTHKKLNIFVSIGLVKNSSGKFVALELSFHIQSL
jgi:hypothetical protein